MALAAPSPASAFTSERRNRVPWHQRAYDALTTSFAKGT
jgi:hypothetical protein